MNPLKNYIVQQYNSDCFAIWNAFIAQAKNATFLFHRDFMEYHRDRFEDFSLMVFDEKQNLKAVLPANQVGEKCFSHQGLTYGGLVFNNNTKLSEVISIFKGVLEYLKQQNVGVLEVKIMPSIYWKTPSSELEYLAYILNANLSRRDTLSVIDLRVKNDISQGRKQEIKKAKNNGLVIQEVQVFDEFWNEILIPNLKLKHNAKPVHTLEEITLLKNKFPKNIRQFNVYLDKRIVAGTTIFETEEVAHSQYISSINDSKFKYSLDYLHDYLINDVFKNKRYFDFGISNENNGKNINNGLLFWKESFGARTMTQSFYQFNTNNYELLNSILI
jgi:hypothetical protein